MRGYLKPSWYHWKLSSPPRPWAHQGSRRAVAAHQAKRAEMLHETSLPSTAGGGCPCPLSLGTSVCSLCQHADLHLSRREGSFLSPPLSVLVFSLIFSMPLLHTAPGFLSICAPALSELLHEDFLLMPCHVWGLFAGGRGKEPENTPGHLLPHHLSAKKHL